MKASQFVAVFDAVIAWESPMKPPHVNPDVRHSPIKRSGKRIRQGESALHLTAFQSEGKWNQRLITAEREPSRGVRVLPAIATMSKTVRRMPSSASFAAADSQFVSGH
jgi:hypothetical protein